MSKYQEAQLNNNGGLNKMNKTAKELFKEYGWDYVGGDERLITYSHYSTHKQLQFYHDTKTYMITECLPPKHTILSTEVDSKTHKLIAYQLKELGWLDE